MRRFDQRKQLPGEPMAEFEQALKTLRRHAWPKARLQFTSGAPISVCLPERHAWRSAKNLPLIVLLQ